MSDTNYKVIQTRRHEKIKECSDIWDLVKDSYAGGHQYIEGDHLIKYHRESNIEYKSRKERAVYFNYLQPIVDILVGFLYETPPNREVVPDKLSFMIDKPYRNHNLQKFMQQVATEAFCYPCFILIDSPEFNPEEFDTVARQTEAGLHPYAVLYRYNEIRDFDIDDSGNIRWILLDVTSIDKTDPTAESVKQVKYRLWTPTYVQDFIIDTENDQVLPGEQVINNAGVVPGIFVDIWTGLSDDSIDTSPSEDIALISKRIYNNMSYMDEMLASGSFKNLFYPTNTSGDLPTAIEKNGVGSLPVIPFDGTLGKGPYYDGADLGDIKPFIDAIQLYIREIFRKIGMELPEDAQNGWNESGRAKSIEFRKTEGILRNAAVAMENVENTIFQLAAQWQNGKFEETITYTKNFEEEELNDALTRLLQVFSMPVDAVKKAALRRIVKKAIPDLDEEETEQIKAEIDSYEESEQIDVNDYLEQDGS